MRNRYPFIIVGGGAAAFAAATRAAELGVKTLMVNAGLPLGGTCVNVGCLPSKHLLAVGDALFYSARPAFDSIPERAPTGFDLRTAIRRKREMIAEVRSSNYEAVLAGFGEHVDFKEGHARLVNACCIEVNGETVAGEKVLLATGAAPLTPPIPGLDSVPYLTNETILELEELPESLAVIGGGPLGLEFAQMFRHFASQVTVFEAGERILPREEPEVSDELRRRLEEEGIVFHLGARVERLHQEGGYAVVRFRSPAGDGLQEARAVKVLLATGVRPNTADLGLATAGVQTDAAGFILVNERYETSQPHVYAAGDCVGRMLLESVAAKEGQAAASNALDGARKTLDYDAVPHAVFTSPQVASVGLTEEEMIERSGVCSCRTISIAQLPKARATNETRGLVKMVIDPEDGRIAGVHIVGPGAAEIIHEAALAVRFRLTVDDVIDTVHVFPTFSEGVKTAALAFRRDVSQMACCIG